MDRRRRDTVIDLGLCAAMIAVALPPMLDGDVNHPRATTVGPLLLPALLLSVLLRRRHPLAAAVAFAAGCVLSAIPTFDQFRLVVAVPVAVLVLVPLARRCDLRDAVVGLALVLAGLTFVGATESVLDGVAGVADMVAFSFPLSLAVWGAARVARARERVAVELAARSEQLVRQREATAAIAVEIDRERLALDLELAARSRLQEMIALASGGDRDAATGRARFARIEALGRESLDQMRGLLGLLRSSDPGARAPRPTLAQLDGLLAGARAGGRVIDLAIEGEHRPLTAAVELGAYRVVQHALVAVREDEERPATVALRYLPDRLELEVRGARSDGSGAEAALLAARERVIALGGSFTAGAAGPSAGRVLLASLPAHA